jgi:hypothetical protein
MPSALALLFAVAVGALLPVAYQLTMTLRAARRLITAAGPRLNSAIDDFSAAALSANRSLSALDSSALQRTANGIAEMGDLARKARQFTASIETAAAVGAVVAPAVAAVVRAWRADDPVPVKDHEEEVPPGDGPPIQ